MDPNGSNVITPLKIDLSIVERAPTSEFMLEAESQNPAVVPAVMLSVVELFQATINGGMFGHARLMTSSGFQIIESTVLPGKLRQRWTAPPLGAGAYRIFLNLIEVVHALQGPLTFIGLRSAHANGVGLTLRDVITAAYPARTEAIRFTVKLPKRLADLHNPRVRISFIEDIHDEGLDLFERLFATWDHLITHGGYGRGSELQLDDAINLGETYMVSPNTVEHTFEAVVGRPEAFDALINMAAAIHDRFRPLSSFEIE